MAKPIPAPEAQQNGISGEHPPVRPRDEGPRSVNLELWNGADPPDERNSAAADENLEEIDGPAEAVLSLEQELFRLRDENIELRRLLEEASQQAEQAKDLEKLLEEKTEVIRDLHRKLAETQERHTAPVAMPHEEDLLALSEELERERKQLQEDEEALMQQMREMEVQMSRERAELARQRNELQRLQAEIRHELELAGRDATLRERLAPLQRRHQEIMSRRGAAPPAQATRPAATPTPTGTGEEDSSARKDSSILRRWFG